MRIVLKNLRGKDWLCLLISAVFIVAQVWLDLRLPDYMSEITTLVQTPGSPVQSVMTAGFWMLACALGSLAASVVTGFFVARVGAVLAMRLRWSVFERTMEFSLEEMSRFSAPSLITRCTNDVTQVQNFVTLGLQMLIKAPITAIWAIRKIAGKNMFWTVTTVATIAGMVLLIFVILLLTLPKTVRVQKLTDDLNGVTREHLTGIRVVHAYDAYAFGQNRFDAVNDELTAKNLFVNRAMALLSPATSFLMNGLSLAIYFTGAFIIEVVSAGERLPVFSEMVVFSSYATQVVSAFIYLIAIFFLLPRAIVSMNRISQVVRTKVHIQDGLCTAEDRPAPGTVEFRQVSFCYPGAKENALTDISFTARPGETVAIIGATGCGKTTLLNLIPRLYDATEGTVLVGGRDVREYRLDTLRGQLGYVPQKNQLFSGTIADNINYGDNGRFEATLREIKAAAEVGQAREFIEKKAEAYQARVAQGGANFSGGQKQRLAIARAVCRDPEIFLFDDSFSALDYKTDKALRESLRRAAGNATILIVAQRISTIRNADRIIVLDEGRIVGQGRHDELMKTCPVYHEIALSQLSEKEAT